MYIFGMIAIGVFFLVWLESVYQEGYKENQLEKQEKQLWLFNQGILPINSLIKRGKNRLIS